MTTQIPQDFLKDLAKQRGVSEAELETVMMALDGNSTAAIATILEISNIAVRKRLGEVYRKFNIAGRGPGKLAELRHQLFYQYQANDSEEGANAGISLATTPTVAIGTRRQDWGEAPDVSVFYGRNRELDTLERSIVDDRSRLVALLGMAGIGKTLLSVQIAKELQDEFDCVIWRSLRHAPPLEHLLANLLQHISNQKKVDLPSDTNAIVSRLLEYLRKQRCLVILDDFETVLQSEELAGNYREGYEGYRDLLKRVGETNHQSCLLIASSEQPTELALLEGEKVRLLQPSGAEEIARELFKEKGISATAKEWQELMERYGENLLAFKIVAATIKDFFNGNVSSFLSATKLFVEDTISGLLEAEFERLSNAEEEIIYWLAIERTPVSLSRLREDILVQAPMSDLLKALESLGRRSLIQKHSAEGETTFTLQPLIMKYATNQFVDQIYQEIQDFFRTQRIESLRLFKSHALSKELPKEKGAKEKKTLSLIKLVNNRLQAIFMKIAGYEELVNILNKISSMLQDKSQLEVGYASINIRHLLAELTNS